MPIYAYRCETCGFENDHLQKLSDQPLSICPQCGQAAYRKQVTAAGFQLKGNGWYATDFKGSKKAEPAATEKPEGKASAVAPDTAAANKESTTASPPATAKADTAAADKR